MTRLLTRPWFQHLIAFALGAVFVVAAIPKIADAKLFSQSIENYRLLPFPAINPLAITLPWIELVNGILVILGPWRRQAAAVLALLLVVFMGAIGSALYRGLYISCGCFGAGGAAVGYWSLALDVALFLAALCLVALPPRRSPSADAPPAVASPA